MLKPAFKIVLIYLVAGILWMMFSDKVLNSFIASNANKLNYSVISRMSFILISSVLIFTLLKIEFRRQGKLKSNIKNGKKIEEHSFKVFIDYINDAAYIYELAENIAPGPFLEVNQKMVEQLGYSKEELLMMHPYDILAPGIADIIKRTENQLINTKHLYLEIDHVNNVGKKFPVEVSLHLFEIDGRRLVFGTVKDIREQKKYIRKLRKAKEKAEESDRLKSAFLENMSHEIRTPMNGIVGFSDLIIQDDLDNEQKAAYSNLIKRSTRQLLSIVNDILDISRIETGQMTLIDSVCSLNKIMDDLYNTHANELSIKDNKLEIGYSKCFSDGDDIILADQFRLQQTLNYLISNAIKFTFSGTINFGYTLKSNSFLEFWVRDTGIGIPENKLSLVFERFRQADDSNTREYGGTGLGLPIAKGIVELMNGSIWIISKTGNGTTVKFTIPYRKSTSIKVSDEIKPKIEKANFSDKTILIVEDNYENSKLLEEIAKFFKVNVIKAFNGSDAISYIYQNNNINLVFMDIRLPDMSGLEVIGTIKELISAPIVAQTAYASEEDKTKCLAAGCNDYMAKPVVKEEFERMLVKYLS